jgi:hypothetical protein
MPVRPIGLCAMFALVSFLVAGCSPASEPEPAAPPPQAHATLNQLMKGIMFPNSNVIFAVQDRDPSSVPTDADGSASTSLSSGIYGGWPSVENAGLAIAEAASLLTVPGRVCQNGTPVPVENDDFRAAAQGLIDVGLAAHEAATTRDVDAFLAISDQLVTACAACHDVYRDRIVDGRPLSMAERCSK